MRSRESARGGGGADPTSCGAPTSQRSSSLHQHAKTNQTESDTDRGCCLCWCCCCTCNEPASKRQEVPHNKENFCLGVSLDLGAPPPTLEDKRAWGQSFDQLMSCAVGRQVFQEFLRCEYSEENIMFYLACEDLKRQKDPSVVEEKARAIYEDYISILSPNEVSLDSRVRDIINTKMRAPTASTFDEAQQQIYTLMHRDSYPRFVNSPMFRQMTQLNTTSRKQSSC